MRSIPDAVGLVQVAAEPVLFMLGYYRVIGVAAGDHRFYPGIQFLELFDGFEAAQAAGNG